MSAVLTRRESESASVTSMRSTRCNATAIQAVAWLIGSVYPRGVNPYLPPEAGPTPPMNAPVAPLESPPVPATFGIRAGARIVDLIVGAGAGFIGGGVAGGIIGVAMPEKVHELSKL